MTEKIIPPRRDEILSQKGIGELRFLRYLEDNADQTNNATELTEADPSSINLSNAQISQINKKIGDIVSENLITQNALVSKLNKRIVQLENTILSNNQSPQISKKVSELVNEGLISQNAIISKLNKKIEQLETTLLSKQDTALNKKISQLEVESMAPYFKTRYDKLQIRTAIIENLIITAGIDVATTYSVNGTQVVQLQGANVSDATGGTTIDAEARLAINALLSRVRAHGLIA
jgi:hypothetical protein